MANFIIELALVIMNFEMIFAVAVTGLLLNLVLIVRIKFGEQIVTNLTMRPYFISFTLFAIIAIEFLCINYIKHVTFLGDEIGFNEEFYKYKSLLNSIAFISMMQIK